ncbi:MAG: AsmA family protein, partial [Bacteroidales bacterium]
MREKQKPSLSKRIFKYTLYTILSICLLITGVIAFALNIVFTPAKLTPVVRKEAQKFLKSDLATQAVELTFFSSFPEFQLHVRNGSISQLNDTLIQFGEISAGIRPLAYLTSQKIHLGTILFKDATIHALIPESGNPNWDIVKADSTNQAADTVAGEMPVISEIKLDRIAFEQVNLSFTDIPNRTHFDLSGLNASISGSFGKIHNELNLSCNSSNIRFEQQGKVLIDKLAFGIDTRLQINNETHTYQTEKMILDLNGMKAGCAGSVIKDSANNEYTVDIQAGLNIPSLAEVLKLIPKSVIKEAIDVTTDGDILVTGAIKGVYGNGKFPVADLKANIDKGSFQYKGMPYGVDQLDLKMEGHIDLNDKAASRLSVQNFLFK